MNRHQNIAVVSFGYNNEFAFEDANSALELMAIMSKSVAVSSHCYGLGDQPHSHFLAEDSSMPELKFIPSWKFNTNETVKEAKERMESERSDREDIDQNMREAPSALPAPVPGDIPF